MEREPTRSLLALHMLSSLLLHPRQPQTSAPAGQALRGRGGLPDQKEFYSRPQRPCVLMQNGLCNAPGDLVSPEREFLVR
jgi:hypothetical protein